MKKMFVVFGMAVLMSLSVMSGDALSAKKDQLLIGMPGDPTTFDPHIRLGLPMLQSWPLVFDNILARDIKGKIIPALATSWSYVSPTVLELNSARASSSITGSPSTRMP